MRPIDDLLEFYVNNSAVEWRSLDSIASRHKGFSVTAKLINEQKSNKEGILVFGAGSTKAYFSPNLVPENRTVKTECIIVKSRGYIDFEYCSIPCAHKSELWSYTCDSSLISTKFVYYFLKTITESLQRHARATSVKIPQLSVGDTDSLMIPVPPLEVQEEIVRILDSFTKLEANLQTELESRRKQYEYCKDKLFSFSNEIPLLTLSDIADIGTGSSNTNEAIDAGKYPFFVRSQEPLRKNDYDFDETAIITAGDGVGVGKVYHYVDGKYALHQRAYRIHINTPRICPKFFFHYMKYAFLTYIEKTMYHGSVPSIRRPMLNRFPVPVPPLAEQERIVAILDKFDSLVNDLSSGLPAEIEARRKQYEYYRDQLLTFTPNNSRTANLSRATAS